MSAEAGLNFTFNFLKKRMKEKKITQNELAEMIGVSVTTLVRYFKQETDMPLVTYYELLGILELRPYIIPTEIDPTEMERMFFN